MGRVVVMLLWLGAPMESLVPQQRSAAEYELEWSAPPTCPGLDDVRAQIDAMAELQDGATGTLSVSGTVSAASDGFALALETEYDGQADGRTLRAATCEELADAAALVVALSLDPHAQRGEEARAPSEHASEAPARPTQPEDEPAATAGLQSLPPRADSDAREPSPVAGRGPRWRPRAWGARLAPFVEYGLLPRLSGGPSLAALALWDRWSFELRGSFEAGRPTERRGGARGRMRLGGGAARACWRLQTQSLLEFPVCGVFEAGRARAVSERLEPEATVTFAHAAPGVGAGLALRGRRVGLVVGAETLFPLQRAAVTLGEDRVFTTRPASIRGIVGIEIFFATDPT